MPTRRDHKQALSLVILCNPFFGKESHMSRLKIDRIDWHKVLPRLGIPFDYIEKPNRHSPCPIEPGDGWKRFRMDNRGGRGTWICSHCGSGDGVRLVALVNGVNDAEALRMIKDVLQDTGQAMVSQAANHPCKPIEKSQAELDKARDSLRKVWGKSIGLTKTPSLLYLQNRVHGLDPAWLAPSLRHGRALFHYDEDTTKKSMRPALLALVSDASVEHGFAVTLHRTYIDQAGMKAAVSPGQEKKLMSSCVQKIDGESIMLNTAVSEYCIVTEGIENGLAWVAATRNRYRVFAAVNCNNMAKFKWPRDTKGLLIAGDHDAVNPRTGLRPGYHNAMLLKERALSAGVPAFLKIPKHQGVDWDDLWNAEQLDQFSFSTSKDTLYA
jgi:putative DNA primase/helicase